MLRYFGNLSDKKSLEPLKLIESYLKLDHSKKLNWLRAQIFQLHNDFINKASNKYVNYVFQETRLVAKPMGTTDEEVVTESTPLTKVSDYSKKEESVKEYLAHKQIKIFISHASNTINKKELTIGEAQFVKAIVKMLKNKYGKKSIFYYEDEHSLSVNKKIISALSNSKIGLLICSQRFINNYQIDGSWPEIESNEFLSRYNSLREVFDIPVLYGITRKDFGANGIPWLKGHHSIEVYPPIDPTSKSYNQLTVRAFKQIESTIKLFEKHNKIKL